VQEAICIYRRDLDNMPGSRRQYLKAVEEDTEFMFLTNAISLSGNALAYASACAKPN
jgi:glutamate synthase (NADPH) small chain